MILILHFQLFCNATWKFFVGLVGPLIKKNDTSRTKCNPWSWTTHVDNAILGARWFTSLVILLISNGKEKCEPYVSETSQKYRPEIWWPMAISTLGRSNRQSMWWLKPLLSQALCIIITKEHLVLSFLLYAMPNKILH